MRQSIGRAFWNGVLFALIGGLTSALAWPDDKALTWRFWAGSLLGSAVAIKAFIAKSGEPNSANNEEDKGPQ